jgi:hypothetical protein
MDITDVTNISATRAPMNRRAINVNKAIVDTQTSRKRRTSANVIRVGGVGWRVRKDRRKKDKRGSTGKI